jgi:hypothetical protein
MATCDKRAIAVMGVQIPSVDKCDLLSTKGTCNSKSPLCRGCDKADCDEHIYDFYKSAISQNLAYVMDAACFSACHHGDESPKWLTRCVVVESISSTVEALEAKTAGDSNWEKNFGEFLLFLQDTLRALTISSNLDPVDYSDTVSVSQHTKLKETVNSSLDRFLKLASTVSAEKYGFPEYTVLDLYRFTSVGRTYSSQVLFETWGLTFAQSVSCGSVRHEHLTEIQAALISRKYVPEHWLSQLVIENKLHNPTLYVNKRTDKRIVLSIVIR